MQTSGLPTGPDIIGPSVRAGKANTIAEARGSSRSSTGFRPGARIASTFSLIFIEPICAVSALTVRPASKLEARRIPNSRRNEKRTRSIV